jgi:hypothetical protein
VIDPTLLRDWWLRLECIDFGAAKLSPERREALYRQLEEVADQMLVNGFDTKLIDRAIQYFSTDPEKSKTYLHGGNDIGDGRGLIAILKSAN